MLDNLYKVLQFAIVGGSVVAALIIILAAFRSGTITEIRFGNLFRASSKARKESEQLFRSLKASSDQELPFETEQLARYYGEVLTQSKISFWFSLFFAVIGFLVIIVAAFMFSSRADATAWIQMLAGTIIDAVAALFFVQSRRAQKSMADFFDKLRLDRQHTDSKTMCDTIENPTAKDVLKIQLSLYYAGIENSASVAKGIIGEWLSNGDEGEGLTKPSTPTE